MNCQRCHGLLVAELFSDLMVEEARLYPGTRCINCGRTEDLWVGYQSPTTSRGDLVGTSQDGEDEGEGVRMSKVRNSQGITHFPESSW